MVVSGNTKVKHSWMKKKMADAIWSATIVDKK